MPVLQHWEGVDGEQNTTLIAIVKFHRVPIELIDWILLICQVIIHSHFNTCDSCSFFKMAFLCLLI